VKLALGIGGVSIIIIVALSFVDIPLPPGEHHISDVGGHMEVMGSSSGDAVSCTGLFWSVIKHGRRQPNNAAACIVVIVDVHNSLDVRPLWR